jgi:ribosomal protein L11 methyltransferase
VTVAAPDEDLASAVLWEHGTHGIEVRPDDTGRTALLAYFPDAVTPESLAFALGAIPDASLESMAIPEVDWVARFREGFHAFAAGRFRIVPAWEVPARRDDVLLVDPGRAFGTGTHETTRLCLAALESLSDHGPLGRVLDVGTGTGILAIAAVRLGASLAAAVDLDPDAMESARIHGRLNHVPLHIVQGDGGGCFRPAVFDVVLANLTTPLLLERALELAGLTRPSGVLVLAGSLREDEEILRAVYAPLGRLETRADGEWLGLLVRRPPA